MGHYIPKVCDILNHTKHSKSQKSFILLSSFCFIEGSCTFGLYLYLLFGIIWIICQIKHWAGYFHHSYEVKGHHYTGPRGLVSRNLIYPCFFLLSHIFPFSCSSILTIAGVLQRFGHPVQSKCAVTSIIFLSCCFSPLTLFVEGCQHVTLALQGINFQFHWLFIS